VCPPKGPPDKSVNISNDIPSDDNDIDVSSQPLDPPSLCLCNTVEADCCNDVNDNALYDTNFIDNDYFAAPSSLEGFDLDHFTPIINRVERSFSIKKSGVVFKSQEIKDMARIPATVNGQSVELIGDTGNLFKSVCSIGMAKKLGLKLFNLKRTRYIRSVSNHFMQVTQASVVVISLIAPTGHSLNYKTLLYIIPGDATTVILCVQELHQLGLVDFMKNLQSVIQQQGSKVIDLVDKCVHPLQYIGLPDDLSSLASIKPVRPVSSASQFVKLKHVGSIPKKPVLEFNSSGVEDPEELPTVSPFEIPDTTVVNSEANIKKLLQAKFDLFHPSKCDIPMDIWLAGRDAALEYWDVFKVGLDKRELSKLPMYDLEGRVDVNAPQIPIKPPVLNTFSKSETIRKVLDYCAWTGCFEEIERWVDYCIQCVQHKGNVQRPYGVTIRGTKRNSVLYMDFCKIGKSRPYDGIVFEWVLIVKDSFTGYVELFPAVSADAKAAARGLYTWYTTYKIWEQLVSDGGSHFTAQAIQEFNRLAKAKVQHHCVPDIHQTVGGIEVVCHHMLVVLRCLMSEDLTQLVHWVDFLPMVKKLLNERPDASRGGYTHKQLFLGMDTDEPIDIVLNSSLSVPFARDVSKRMESDLFKTHMEKLANQLNSHHAICDEVWRRHQNDRIRRRSRKYGVQPANFKLGDYVMIAHVNYKLDRLHKLQAKWMGPFEVIEIVNDFVYRVKDLRSYPSMGKITTHHCIRMKRYASKSEVPMSEYLRQQAEYSISLFQVAAIKQHRLNETTKQYEVLVKWFGLNNTENSWNPLRTIYAHAPHETEHYLKKLSVDEQKTLRNSIKS
jgi:hypothetical protein